MKNLRSFVINSLMIITASLVTFSSVAYADGLKSQWKTRQPMPTGLVKVEKPHSLTFFQSTTVLVTQSEKKGVPRLITQKKERLQTRVIEKEETVQKESVVSASSASFGINDKIRSIRRMQKPTNSCAVLHTHERARCQRDLAYSKTNQYRAHVATEGPRTVVVGVR